MDRGAGEAPPALAPVEQVAQPVRPSQPQPEKLKAVATSVPVSPLAARIAAEHGVDLGLIRPSGNRIQKEDVLAYIAAWDQEQTVPAGRVPASPKARRLAADHRLNLASINGSGPEGAVLAADVLAVAERPVTIEPAPQEAAPDTVPMNRMWKVMADRLVQSWTTVPHFYLAREIDAGQLAGWYEQLQLRLPGKITYTDLLVKLVAGALRQHPRLNAKWQAGSIVLNQQVNIGLAVAVEEGLLVPVLRNADQLGLSELAARRMTLVERAQKNSLTLDDLSDGTFTISNLGMYGVESFSAIVNPPQAAILAVGRIVERVVPFGGQAVIRPRLALTLSCDHRIVDGARAARFLDTLAGYMETPSAF